MSFRMGSHFNSNILWIKVMKGLDWFTCKYYQQPDVASHDRVKTEQKFDNVCLPEVMTILMLTGLT